MFRLSSRFRSACLAAACSRATSASFRSLQRPGRSFGSRSGPIATRRSDDTGWPIASHMFRTWRFLPSRTVISSVASSLPRLQHLHESRLRAPAFDADALGESGNVVCVGHAQHARFIDTRDGVPRMREARGQFAVVGQDQQPLGVEVETADGVDVVADVGDQVDHRRALVRVRPGGHVAGRLVEQDVPMPFGDLDAAAVHADVVPPGIGFRAQFTHRGAVDGDSAVEHQLLTRASRRDAGLREDLL